MYLPQCRTNFGTFERPRYTTWTIRVEIIGTGAAFYLDFLDDTSLPFFGNFTCHVRLANGDRRLIDFIDHFQFLRMGYFCADSRDSKPGHLVFNRSVMLKGSYKPE